VTPRLSVCGLAQRNGAYLIVQRSAGGSQGLKWEFPGGKVEEGETPQQALVREWSEELALKVTPVACRSTVAFRNGAKEYQLQAWSVELAPGELDLREHLKAAWVVAADLPGYDLSDSDRQIAEYLAISG
jgi:mutator protein MutT